MCPHRLSSQSRSREYNGTTNHGNVREQSNSRGQAEAMAEEVKLELIRMGEGPFLHRIVAAKTPTGVSFPNCSIRLLAHQKYVPSPPTCTPLRRARYTYPPRSSSRGDWSLFVRAQERSKLLCARAELIQFTYGPMTERTTPQYGFRSNAHAIAQSDSSKGVRIETCLGIWFVVSRA